MVCVVISLIWSYSQCVQTLGAGITKDPPYVCIYTAFVMVSDPSGENGTGINHFLSWPLYTLIIITANSQWHPSSWALQFRLTISHLDLAPTPAWPHSTATERSLHLQLCFHHLQCSSVMAWVIRPGLQNLDTLSDRKGVGGVAWGRGYWWG